MAKPSALSKVIRQFELELEMHERAVTDLQHTLARLRAAQTTQVVEARTRPTAVEDRRA